MEPRSPIPTNSRRRPVVAALTLAAVLVSCGGSEPAGTSSTTAVPSSLPTDLDTEPDNVVPEDGAMTTYRVDVVATYPHDPAAWTQGLEVVGDLLLESTGLEGASTIRLVEPTTGAIVRSADVDPDLFAEGATVLGDEIWQVTWRNETVLVHGLDDLGQRRRLTYQGEGWGLCAGDDRFIMSNGSDRLTFRDPGSFAVLDSVAVVEELADGSSVAVGGLNELECVGDVVWANLYQTTRLVAIDPARGLVVGQADLAELVPPGLEGRGDTVANGVAHDPATGRFWLTGKFWPVLYEVELVPIS